ncbi:MAG: creatininase family protein [Polyangiaceae bacterium]
MTERVHLAELTTEEVAAVVAKPPSAVLLPVGSVEPHGPHLPLGTDTLLSEESSRRAASMLRGSGVATWIAPSVPYGVTDFAAGFSGAIGVDAAALTAFLSAIVARFLDDGWSHVCLVNNHLEPAHDQAVRGAIAGLAKGRASVACPLTKRWGRTLSDEFKRGNCHAGQYETSLVLAAGGEARDERASLPTIEVSLSDGIRAGQATFRAMGLDRAYTGSPADATREEGEALYGRLAAMIATEVLEALGRV